MTRGKKAISLALRTSMGQQTSQDNLGEMNEICKQFMTFFYDPRNLTTGGVQRPLSQVLQHLYLFIINIQFAQQQTCGVPRNSLPNEHKSFGCNKDRDTCRYPSNRSGEERRGEHTDRASELFIKFIDSAATRTPRSSRHRIVYCYQHAHCV